MTGGNNMRTNNTIIRFVSVLAILTFALSWYYISAFATEEDSHAESITGGGYAATSQIENAGYTSVIYDATNGLPTSDANFILGASDGYVCTTAIIGRMGGRIRPFWGCGRCCGWRSIASIPDCPR